MSRGMPAEQISAGRVPRQACRTQARESRKENPHMAENKHSNNRRSRAPIVRACCVAGAGLAVIGLAACGSSSPAASKSSTVTLKFWNQYNEVDGEQKAMVDIVIPAFEKANPGIKVQSIYYNDNVIEQKFLAAAAAGDPPDVMRADIADVPALANQGTLTDLGKVMTNYKAITANALPGPLATNEWKGQYYGLPLDTNTQALYWNKSLFAAAGLSGPPTTLTQLVSDAQKLTNKSKGVYGLGVDGTDIWNVAPYIWSMGGSFTSASYSTATGYMDSSATEAAVQTLVNLYRKGDIGTDFLGGTGAVSGEEGFPKGQYAMYIDGPWAVPTFAADKNVPSYGIAQFPSGSGGSVSTVGGEDVIIPAGTQHLADAEKFAAFLDQSLSQLEMAKQGDMSVMKTDGAGEVKNDPYDAVFATQLQTARDRAVVPNYQVLDTDFSDALQKILAGKVSVDAGLAQAATAADSALSSSS
jgi:multiple sugar transport system substrate-binding protein